MDLKTLVLTSAAAVAVAFAQAPTTTTFSLVTQIKCKPGKTAECEEYLSTSLRKAMQLRVERGLIDSFSLYRLVDPSSTQAGFTHTYVVTSAKPFPAEPSEAYRKAGEDSSGMSTEAYLAKANEIREIVHRYRAKTIARAGTTAEKGDYSRIHFLKMPPAKKADLRENMRLRAALMEQLVKSGRIRSYGYREVMFRGEADPFDATETLTYKDPQTAMDEPPSSAQLKAAFEAGNPGKDYQQFVNARTGLLHVQMVRTLKVVDAIRK